MDLGLAQLLDMGLSLPEATAALSQANGVVERALELHFTGQVKPVPASQMVMQPAQQPAHQQPTLHLAQSAFNNNAVLGTRPAAPNSINGSIGGGSSSKTNRRAWPGFEGETNATALDTPAREDGDDDLNRAIAESLRMARGIPDHVEMAPTDRSWTVPPIPPNPIDRMRSPNGAVGLHGLTGMSAVRCVVQALHRFVPAQRALLAAVPAPCPASGAGSTGGWSSVRDDWTVAVDKTPASSLLVETQKVLAGLALSSRAFKSSMRVEEAFVAYCRLINKQMPSEFSETWAYLAHALSTEVSPLLRITHIQVHQDQSNQTGETLTSCINIDPHVDIYISLDKALGLSVNHLSPRSYIYSREYRMHDQGRLMPLMFRGPTPNPGGRFTKRDRIYIDRYLGRNSDLVAALLRQRVMRERELDEYRRRLIKFNQREFDVLKATIQFLKSQSDLGRPEVIESLENVYQSMADTVLSYRKQIEDLEHDIEQTFEMAELKRLPFDLYAVFAIESGSRHVVYVRLLAPTGGSASLSDATNQQQYRQDQIVSHTGSNSSNNQQQQQQQQDRQSPNHTQYPPRSTQQPPYLTPIRTSTPPENAAAPPLSASPLSASFAPTAVPNHTSAIGASSSWLYCCDGKTSVVSFDHLHSVQNVTALWYAAGHIPAGGSSAAADGKSDGVVDMDVVRADGLHALGDAGRIHDEARFVPEPLRALVAEDNRAFEQELASARGPPGPVAASAGTASGDSSADSASRLDR
ncbi:hypothetical protein BC831DRAFT_478244 [Entophlyctis helioformis]|nr:hypothetical protein BC831DRAFT_478244 [Entophlyctis helioformis]